MRLFRYANLSLPAGCFLLAACHRDTPTPGPAYDLTGKYVAATTVTAAHSVAMYTKNGLVANPAIVTRFLARRPTSAVYFSATDSPLPYNAAFTLTFRENNRATLLITGLLFTDSIRTEVTNQQQASFLLQNLDSTNFGLSPSTWSCTRPAILSDYARSVVAGRRCVSIPLSSGYRQTCRYRPVRMVGARGSQLYIPYYSWFIQAGGCYAAVGGEWNTFNPDIVSHLVAGDTVVVQEREVALSR